MGSCSLRSSPTLTWPACVGVPGRTSRASCPSSSAEGSSNGTGGATFSRTSAAWEGSPACSASRLDQLVVEQSHLDDVHVTPSHELPPAAAALLLSPDLPVRSNPAGVGGIDGQSDPAQVPPPAPEP